MGGLESFRKRCQIIFNDVCSESSGDHQCGFRRNRLTIDHIFCICQILEKKWECNEEVHQLFIDFKKTYDSVGRSYIIFSLSLVSP